MKRIGDYLSREIPERREPTSGSDVAASRPTSDLQRPTTPDICPICLGKGFLVYDVPHGHPDFNRLVPCRCTEARLAAEHMRDLRNISNVGALDRFTFDNFLPDGAGLPEASRRVLRDAYEISLRFAQDPEGWLVLLGSFGTGKTHLAAAIANYNVTLGRAAMFVVVPDLLDHLRAAFGPSSESGLDERLEAIRSTPLLILDDLGAHNSTAWAQEKLFQILNHRYNGRLPTVITTNQRLEEMDPRIASRLADTEPEPGARDFSTRLSGWTGQHRRVRSRRPQPQLTRPARRSDVRDLFAAYKRPHGIGSTREPARGAGACPRLRH